MQVSGDKISPPHLKLILILSNPYFCGLLLLMDYYLIRVKVSSHRNFVCTEVPTVNHHTNAHQHKGQATINPLQAVVLRHGKVHHIFLVTLSAHDNVLFFYFMLQVSANEYVLDFRDPPSPVLLYFPLNNKHIVVSWLYLFVCLFVCQRWLFSVPSTRINPSWPPSPY